MAGSIRLLTKLNDAVESHKYYEAHQLLKTINFRYMSSKKFEDLEKLLLEHSAFLLDNNQFESGMDVGVMLANLHKSADNAVTENRINSAVSLLRKMPNSPERGQFIHLFLEWIGDSPLSNILHSHAVGMHIAERGYDEAWRHITRLYDGKLAAKSTMDIFKGLGPIIRHDELGLITAHLVLSFLVTKKIQQAEQALLDMVRLNDVHHLSPLLNGVRYLVQAAKTNDPLAFQSIQTLYDLSFARDPNLRKLVALAGKSLFNLTDERTSNRSNGGGLMSIFNAFMGPDMAH